VQSKGAGPHFWQFFAFFLPVSAEIVEDLEAALSQFATIAADLKK